MFYLQKSNMYDVMAHIHMKLMKYHIYAILWCMSLSSLISGCSMNPNQFTQQDKKVDTTQTWSSVTTQSSNTKSEVNTPKDSSNIPLQYKFRGVYDAVFSPNENGMMIVAQWEKFGLISQSGNVILDKIYQKVQKEKNGFYVFDDGFVLPDGTIILLADHPKLQQFQKEPLKDHIRLWITNNLWEKVIFKKTNPISDQRSAFIYDIKEKKIWLPPIYHSLWKVDDDIIVALKDDVIRMFKTDQTILYESTSYTGGYRILDEKPMFHNGVMIMQDDNGLYGFIRKDGTWAIPATYNAINRIGSGTVIAVTKKDNEYAVAEIDTSGKILRTLSQEEGMSVFQYPEIHPDFSPWIDRWEFKNKKTWETFSMRDGNINTNMQLSTIALKKWEKWWIYGFDDYRYDAISFWFFNGHSGDGFVLLDGLAFVTEWQKKSILNANTNKIIFTFSDEEQIFNNYGWSKWFYQINSNLIAVHAEKSWKIIDSDGAIVINWYDKLSILNDASVTERLNFSKYPETRYLFAKKENKSILVSIENWVVQEHILKMDAGAAKVTQGVISLYDREENDVGTTEWLKASMDGVKPRFIGYVYPDGYEKPMQK